MAPVMAIAINGQKHERKHVEIIARIDFFFSPFQIIDQINESKLSHCTESITEHDYDTVNTSR